MCLTEPQCGTDLGQVKTKAIPNGDGSYSLTGTKIFISSGEHDFTDQIVHIVLARLPNAPEGTRGISLFIVPGTTSTPTVLWASATLWCAALSSTKWALKALPLA